MTNREAIITLNMLPKIGPIRVRRLLEHLGSAQNILTAPTHKLTQVQGIGDETAKIITNWQTHADLSAELQLAEKRGIRIITQEDAEYPEPLRKMYDPPLALYIWGEILEKDKHAIAIVGSRKHTHYGRDAAQKLAAELSNAGLTIISGLARGIDTHGHQGALNAGNRTIAVIGSGLNQLYPPENLPIARQIADGHGAIISEFPLNQKPDKKTFPMRNRIVAAWSQAVLVVECPKWSGSIITANLANEMGKTIYAVPGPIDRPTSGGCNQLIRDGATLITSADEILEDLQTLPLVPSLTTQPESTPIPELDPTETLVLESLNKEEKLLDQLIAETDLNIPTLTTTLLKLEMKRLITQLPGPRYIRR